MLNQRNNSPLAAICWIKLTFIVSCSELEDEMIVPSEDHIHNLSMIQHMFGILQVSESAFEHPERIVIIGLYFQDFLV